MKYRTKPSIVDAAQYDGTPRCLQEFPFEETRRFSVEYNKHNKPYLHVPTIGGIYYVNVTDWIIRTKNGRYFSHTDRRFKELYTQVKAKGQGQ
jgi:hypothetical protein